MFEVIVFLGISGGLTLIALKFFGIEVWPGLTDRTEKENILPQFSIHREMGSNNISDLYLEPQPRRRRNLMKTVFSLVFFGTLGGAWYSFGSFDEAYRQLSARFGRNPIPGGISEGGSPPEGPPLGERFTVTTINEKSDSSEGTPNWMMVDGVRWFQFIGTDSGGVGYSGWVPELAFRDFPPTPSPGTKNILQKLGLPDPGETAKAIKQMKNVNKVMKFHLDKQ